MNAALLIVTLVSLGLAIALLVYVARVMRDDRERSEARVAALSEAIADAGPPLAADAAPEPAPEPRRPSAVRDAPPPRPALAFDATPATATEAGDWELDAGAGAGPGPMFGGVGGDTTPSRLAPIAVVGALVLVLALAAVYVLSGGGESSASGTVQAAAAATAPLELVSLRHERTDAGGLTIAGLVRNPHAGPSVRGVVAVAFLFDSSGGFVASGRAPLDFSQIGPGEESPFVITVPAPGSVARYRVSFRTDAGVVPHVDRRPAAPVASR